MIEYVPAMMTHMRKRSQIEIDPKDPSRNGSMINRQRIAESRIEYLALRSSDLIFG